jgi:hypothetical protein
VNGGVPTRVGSRERRPGDRASLCEDIGISKSAVETVLCEGSHRQSACWEAGLKSSHLRTDGSGLLARSVGNLAHAVTKTAHCPSDPILPMRPPDRAGGLIMFRDSVERLVGRRI